MKIKNLKERINAAVNENDDPILLEMILQIFQNSSSVNHKRIAKKTKPNRRDGKVAYSDVLRQGQGCLPLGK